MSLRRVCIVAARVLILAVAVLAVPACKAKEDKAPHLTINSSPAFDASSVSHWPLMRLEFDKALDPATIAANIRVYNVDSITGLHTTEFGTGGAVTYISGTFQVIIDNVQAFTKNKEYAVVIFPGLTAADGTPIVALPTGSIALRFMVENSDFTERPTFSPPVDSGTGGTGQIVWNWSPAQEGAPLADIGATYELYQSLASDDQNMFVISATPTTFPNFTTSGLTAGATYHFRMVVRDNNGNVKVTAEFTGVAGS